MTSLHLLTRGLFYSLFLLIALFFMRNSAIAGGVLDGQIICRSGTDVKISFTPFSQTSYGEQIVIEFSSSSMEVLWSRRRQLPVSSCSLFSNAGNLGDELGISLGDDETLQVIIRLRDHDLTLSWSGTDSPTVENEAYDFINHLHDQDRFFVFNVSRARTGAWLFNSLERIE